MRERNAMFDHTDETGGVLVSICLCMPGKRGFDVCNRSSIFDVRHRCHRGMGSCAGKRNFYYDACYFAVISIFSKLCGGT